MKHGLHIRCKAPAFDGIWSRFRCTGESSAYVLSRIMTAPALHIWQSHLVRRHCRRYWVLQSEYETQLAYSWQMRNFCWHRIEVQEYRECLSSYPYDRLITTHLPIPLQIKSVWPIWSTFVRIWDTGSLIRGKDAAFASLWSKFWCTGESWAYCYERSSTAYLHIPFRNKVTLGDIEYFCQDMRHGLNYS